MDRAATAFVPPGDVALVLARAAFDAALFSTCGTLAFRVLVAPRALLGRAAGETLRIERALLRLAWVGLGLALSGLLAWTVLQARAIAGPDEASGIAAVIIPVLEATRFGHLVLLQACLLIVAMIALRWRHGRLAATLSAVAVAAQAAHGHGMAMAGAASLLFLAGTVHLLAAAGWIGGLLPLLLIVRLAPVRTAAAAARWFSPLGKWCVGMLAGSALLQGRVLVGSLAALRATPYGWLVLIKTALFGMLFGLAVLNRYRLAPALHGQRPEAKRRRLAHSILVQTAFGLLAVLAACVLSDLVPGMDMRAGNS